MFLASECDTEFTWVEVPTSMKQIKQPNFTDCGMFSQLYRLDLMVRGGKVMYTFTLASADHLMNCRV